MSDPEVSKQAYIDRLQEILRALSERAGPIWENYDVLQQLVRAVIEPAVSKEYASEVRAMDDNQIILSIREELGQLMWMPLSKSDRMGVGKGLVLLGAALLMREGFFPDVEAMRQVKPL